MKVPVLWISRHPEILARGYADQGLLEALFARELWTPANAVEFEHHEVMGDFPHADGAVVVLPARHHASPEDVVWFQGELERLKWSVVILAGDEAWEFPWRKVKQTPTRRVWVMQPRPEHSHLDGLLPGGWYPNTHKWIKPSSDRPYDFLFAGQVTHSRREDCMKALEGLPNGFVYQTDGYLRGMPREEYTALLSKAKVIPCPSGPMTVDTARPLEAMEAGAVPVVDMVTPRARISDCFDYWSLCFGEDCPLTRIWDWADFPKILEEELADWPHNSNRIFAFWQQWKRKIVYQLDEQIKAVMDV